MKKSNKLSQFIVSAMFVFAYIELVAIASFSFILLISQI